MKNFFLVGVIILIVLFSGCSQQNSAQFVCPNGAIVDAPSKCPLPQQTKHLEPNPGPVIQNKPKVEIQNETQAVDLITNNEKFKEEWKDAATQRNCGALQTDLKNSIIFVAKMDFEKKFISCSNKNNFGDLEKYVCDLNNYNSQGGFGIIRGCLTTNPDFYNALKNCNNLLIGHYEKMINGFQVNGYSKVPETLSGNLAGVVEYCKDCKTIFMLHTFCEPAIESGMTPLFGTVYVDAETGNVYE